MWESLTDFDPSKVQFRLDTVWVNFEGNAVPHSSLAPSAEFVSNQEIPFDLGCLPLRDPNSFIAGALHYNEKEWKLIDSSPEVLSWIRSGVRVQQYFRHFEGHFKGKAFDSDIPPPAFFPNNPIVSNLLVSLRPHYLRG